MHHGNDNPRPAKKRRFFVEEDSEPESIHDASTSLRLVLPEDGENLPDNSSVRTREMSDDGLAHSSSQTEISQQAPDLPENVDNRPGSTELGFDTELFQSIVGERISPATLSKLRQAAGDNIERAINMYFDGSWQDTARTPPPTKSRPSRPLTVLNGQQSDEGIFVRSGARGIGVGANQKQSSTRREPPKSRYIGAFGVNGWTTRSGTNVIRHGEAVRIERSKIQPSNVTSSRGKGKASANQPPRASHLHQRGDIIVRFTNSRGDEIGRLPKETAAWVSTLIDQKVCAFEGLCVFAPDRVRTNDTIYLQLRCSLLRTAFEGASFKPADNNRTTGIFEAKETEEEKELRLRQVALIKLFSEINLLPSKTNQKAEEHKRQGLLQSAELTEQREKEHAPTTETTGATPQESEEEDGKELEQDQLDTLYKKAQSFDFNTPAAQPAGTFDMDLRHYQKQALHWMIGKEKDEKAERTVSMHPLWEQYAWPTKDVDGQELPMVIDQESFYVSHYSGELSLEFPVQEQNCLGGILADEMGLGKTIEMLSLIHSHKSDIADRQVGPTSSVNHLPRLPKDSSSVERAPCTTLVIAPMSLLAQWQSEAERASKPGTMRSMVYYSNEKTANLQTLCCEANAASAPDLIITSYGVVLSEFNQVAANHGNRGSYGGLFSLEYFRIILDEAHHIKNRQSKTAKACYELAAEHRWVLTGTPIVNRLEDLFSLVRFLRVEPWSNFSFWKTFITVPFESKDFIRALDVVQTVLEPLVLRRTKDMKTPNGEALVPLPPRSIDISEIELSKPEREVYDHIFTRAKRTFAANVEAGTLLKSYTTIFAQILRLRQSCCHPILTRNKSIVADEEDAAAAADIANGLADDMDLQELINRFTLDSDETDANKYGAHVLTQILEESSNECPICSEEPMIDQAVTGCWHSACKKCLLDYIEHQKDKGEWPRCFSCREALNPRDIFEVIKHDDNMYDDNAERPRVSLRRIGANSSAKIAALVASLKSTRREAPLMKSVVFSQFTSFLDMIEPALARDGIPYLRFDGSIAQKARAAVLSEFAKSAKGVVLLLSLRAGGVGLNLTMAKRVYMMDPWWSWAVEAQAIDRVHRMGQDEEVKVVRFIVKDSVEGRMLKIQERKKFIATSLGMMSEEDRKVQRIEDIRELLS